MKTYGCGLRACGLEVVLSMQDDARSVGVFAP